MKYALALLYIVFSTSVYAADATSIAGVPINSPPAGYPNPTYQPCPNCASLTGLVPIYRAEINGGAGGFQLNVPQIAGGPSALTAIPGVLPVNIALTNNKWNFIDSAPLLCSGPPLPVYCYFRGGLVAYPNGGYWNLRDGIATFAGKSGTIYDVGVFVGAYQEPATGFAIQPNMINGGPLQDHYQYVGGGSTQCAGPDNYICQVHFSANLIYCGANGASDSGSVGPVACEIRVAVFPHSPTGAFNAILGVVGSPPGPGSVGPLPINGGTPQGYVTNFYLEQERGL